MIRLVYMKSEEARSMLGSERDILSDERLNQFMRLKQERDRLDCLAVGILLDRTLNVKNIFYKDENGCPRLRGGGYISISHSGGTAAVIVSDKPIGLDIQCRGEREHMNIARLVFAEPEISYLKCSQNADGDFYRLWCLKESYMKARGLGFSLAPKSFQFDISGEKIILNSDDSARWSFRLFNIESLCAAVCFQEDCAFEPEKISLT